MELYFFESLQIYSYTIYSGGVDPPCGVRRCGGGGLLVKKMYEMYTIGCLLLVKRDLLAFAVGLLVKGDIPNYCFFYLLVASPAPINEGDDLAVCRVASERTRLLAELPLCPLVHIVASVSVYLSAMLQPFVVVHLVVFLYGLGTHTGVGNTTTPVISVSTFAVVP